MQTDYKPQFRRSWLALGYLSAECCYTIGPSLNSLIVQIQNI